MRQPLFSLTQRFSGVIEQPCRTDYFNSFVQTVKLLKQLEIARSRFHRS
jgi:hypothetical protein